MTSSTRPAETYRLSWMLARLLSPAPITWQYRSACRITTPPIRLAVMWVHNIKRADQSVGDGPLQNSNLQQVELFLFQFWCGCLCIRFHQSISRNILVVIISRNIISRYYNNNTAHPCSSIMMMMMMMTMITMMISPVVCYCTRSKRRPKGGAPLWDHIVCAEFLITVYMTYYRVLPAVNEYVPTPQWRGYVKSIRDLCGYVSHPWKRRTQPKLAKRTDQYHVIIIHLVRVVLYYCDNPDYRSLLHQ
jgi:hypothetical protein